MQYSPKLKRAMQEIREIMDDNDIAGSIVLHTPGFGEHFVKIDPSYSMAKFEHTPEGSALKLRVKEAEVGKAKAKQLAEDTTNMFHIMTKLVEEHFKIVMYGEMITVEHYNPEQRGPGHSSNQQQSN